MKFSPSSFFIGVGTVLATIGVGFGAGILMTDAFLGSGDREPSKLEQRAADKPDTKVRPIAASVAPVSEAKAVEVPAAAPPPVQPAIQPAPQPQSTVQDSYAKANEADLRKEQRRQDRIKRAEERKAERRRKREHQRAVARARQEEQRQQRQQVERAVPTERVAQSPFMPFNLDD